MKETEGKNKRERERINEVEKNMKVNERDRG